MRCMGLSIARSVCKEVARASVGGASAEGGGAGTGRGAEADDGAAGRRGARRQSVPGQAPEVAVVVWIRMRNADAALYV